MWVRGLKQLGKTWQITIGLSHPMWVRGLKQPLIDSSNFRDEVAPHVGAWIETCLVHAVQEANIVAPHVGAWIETCRSNAAQIFVVGRTPCGCVD